MIELNNVKIDCRNDDGTLNHGMNKAFLKGCSFRGFIKEEGVNYSAFPFITLKDGKLIPGQCVQSFKDQPEREVTMINEGTGWRLSYVGAVPQTELNDAVHQPKHYELMDGIESIEIIAASLTADEWRGFCLGNAVKYRLRAGKKDALQQEIDKANNYTDNLFPSLKHLNRSDR